MTRRSVRPLVVLVALLGSASAIGEPQVSTDEAHGDSRFALHGQLTYVEQESNAFGAPYAGLNSLTPDRGHETVDATLQVGMRLWSGAEAWVDPELDQGFGLDNTLGVAAFPSGAAYKVGRDRPYFRWQRAFVRWTADGNGDTVDIAPSANQFGGPTAENRWVLTLGKFSVPDIFDSNQYAHDPRADFLNWAAIDAGTFDYAADSWGYTLGIAAEWYHGPWTWRAGAFDLSNVPNSEHLASGAHEFQLIAEAEQRYVLDGLAGRLYVTAYDSRADMARLADALAEASHGTVDLAAARRYRSRTGISVGGEQSLGPDLALFARVGSAGGNVETYEFTEIDRAHEFGLSLNGGRWGRGADTVAIALLDNRISGEREHFLAAGGLGILIGDGRLPHPGPEDIVETYYRVALRPWLQLTFDYQWIEHPAYNRDRGPVSVGAIRIHTQF